MNTTKDSKINMNDIKLVEASLSQYSAALRSVESSSFREAAIRDYFDECDSYNSHEYSDVTYYSHCKLQSVHKKFWQSLGYALVRETDFGYTDEIPCKRMDMEIGLKKTMPIYKSATLFYKKGDQKLVLTISNSHHDNDSFNYNVYSQGPNDLFEKWIKLADEENFYKNQKITAGCQFLDLKSMTWNEVILPDSKKKVIQENVEGLFAHRDAYKEFGIPIKRGIILHGPPGTGKTQSCKALAGQMENCTVLYAMPSDFDPSRGGVKRIARMAQDLAPCFLIIEDIDFIAKDRSLGSAGAVIELMNCLDGLEEFGDIVTFGTTNHLDVIENAIKNRPGRFDRIIEIDNPEQAEREAMIRLFTSRFDIQGINISDLAKKLGEKTDSLSGAHIKEICHTAAAFAVRSGSIEIKDGKRVLVLKPKHFKDALKEVGNKDYSTSSDLQRQSSGIGFGAKQRGLVTIEDDDSLM